MLSCRPKPLANLSHSFGFPHSLKTNITRELNVKLIQYCSRGIIWFEVNTQRRIVRDKIIINHVSKLSDCLEAK